MKVRFTAILEKYHTPGDKYGWTYIRVPAEMATQLKPGKKTSFRVKGKLDGHSIEQVSLLPMGGGDFFLAVNAGMRKGIGKKQGASVKVELEADDAVYKMNEDFIACLADEPRAKAFFESLAPSHQRYFNNWIDSAKTDATRAKRIAQSVNGLMRSMDYGQMIRSLKAGE